MLSIFLNRIENMLQSKPQAASTETGSAGPPDTGAAVDADALNPPGAVSTCSRPDLFDLLEIIRDNAAFLEIMYGDSLPIKNIMAATERACAAARVEKEAS